MNAPNDWKNMMFAVGLKANVTKYDHFIVPVYFFECPAKNLFGVFSITGKEFSIGTCDPPRGAYEAFAVRILAYPLY